MEGEGHRRDQTTPPQAQGALLPRAHATRPGAQAVRQPPGGRRRQARARQRQASALARPGLLGHGRAQRRVPHRSLPQRGGRQRLQERIRTHPARAQARANANVRHQHARQTAANRNRSCQAAGRESRFACAERHVGVRHMLGLQQARGDRLPGLRDAQAERSRADVRRWLVSFCYNNNNNKNKRKRVR